MGETSSPPPYAAGPSLMRGASASATTVQRAAGHTPRVVAKGAAMGDMNDQEWEAPGPGPWMQDRAHLPASVTPLLQEIYPRGFAAGFSAALSPYGVLLDTMQLAFVKGFPYTQPVPFDVPGPDGPKSPEELGAEIGRRTAVADAAFANRIWRDTLKSWDEEAKPRSIARHRELAAVDLPSLSDEELQGHLHACMEHMSQMWQQHHTYNGAALVAVGDFVLHAAGWTQRDPVPIFAVFDGWSPVSGVLNPEDRARHRGTARRLRRRGIADRRRACGGAPREAS